MKSYIIQTLYLALSLGCACAAPSADVEAGRISIREGYDAVLAKQIRNESPDARCFYLQDIDIEDLSRFCADFPDTTELEIYSHQLTSLSPLARLRKLEKLSVLASALEGALTIAPLPRLQDLSLIAVPLGEDLDWLAAMSELRSLHLASVSDEELVDARVIARLPHLESLSLGPCTLTHAAALADCKSLTTVTISGNAGLKSLAPLKQLPKLKLLILEEGAFKSSELKGFPADVKVEVMEAEPSY